MRVVVFGALNGLAAVALGAVGAHLLEGTTAVSDAEVLSTALTFHLVHAATLVGMGGLTSQMLPTLLGAASWALGLGMIVFCGALYAVAFGLPDEIGAAAPVGGGLLLLGWLLLAIAAARRL